MDHRGTHPANRPRRFGRVTEPFAWTHQKTDVAFDGTALTINGKAFPVDRIERLIRSITYSHAQGSWNALECDVHVFADGAKGSVLFRGDAGTEEWGPWRPLWDQFYEMVHDEIEARLLGRTLERMFAGEEVEIGSLTTKGRGRLVVTSKGCKVRRPFAKEIPWASASGVSVASGTYQLDILQESGKVKAQNVGLGVTEWDAWQVPLLWKVFHDR
jgi:hypothetical protein